MRLLATALLTSGLMLAQHHHDAEGPDKHVVADEYLKRPIALMPGVGKLPLKGTTTAAEAQQYSDQGHALLASYVWLDAIRSFKKAVELDPDFALAHMGLARSYWGAGKRKEAQEALANARTAASKRKLPEQEEAHVKAYELQVAAMLDESKTQKEKHEALKKHLDAMVARDPADAWAWVLRGQAEESGPWGRGQGGRIAAIAFYETALVRDPQRWDANHYLIHSYENVGNFGKAEEHGRAYRANADAVPHAHHMHGHILPRVNQWEQARTAFERADTLHREVFQREKLSTLR